MRVRSAMLVGLLSLVVGCAGSYHFYPGGHLPEAELATIKPSKKISFIPTRTLNVFPILIDGNPTESYRGPLPSYFVLPGEHTLEVALFALPGSGPGFRFTDPEPMTFPAKAGHTYVTRAYLPDLPEHGDTLKVSFWIEDEATGEVVSGTRLTE